MPPLPPTGPATAPPEEAAPRAVPVRLELPARTIAKVVGTVALVLLLAALSDLLLELFIAFLATAALDPPVSRLERRGLPRPASVALILAALLGLLALVVALAGPPLLAQGAQVATDLPGYVARSRRLFGGNDALYRAAHAQAQRLAADPGRYADQFVAVGTGLLSFGTALFVVVAATGYLLVDGERTYFWLTRYLPPRQRAKLRRALPEVSAVVSGYVRGQLLTSLLYGGFAYLVLAVLGVPQALLLALLAAVADAIPIVGAFLSAAPAVLLALTVSVPTAGGVLLAYLVYQQVENFYIVPRVYRGALPISAFAVLVAVLVGGKLLGVVGALLALPVAATIPALERIWVEEPEAAPPPASGGPGDAGAPPPA
jgi:predicted PurR-regulated permease PerM